MKKEWQIKGSRGIKTIIFGRTLIVAVAFIIQFLLLGVTFFWAKEYSGIVYAGFSVLGLIALLHIFNSRGNPDFKLVWMLPLYYWNQIQYRLSDTSLTIKQGGIGWHSNTIPWSAVTNVSTVRKGFRIDYVKSDGKKGFYIVRENYIDDAGEMRKLIEKQVCLNGKVEES